MKETKLWEGLRAPLNRKGKFQKISDRFTGGVPDVLGCLHSGVGYAIELKQLSGVKIHKTKFRPGQIDWLKAWPGIAVVISSTPARQIYVHLPQYADMMVDGMTTTVLQETASIVWKKTPRNQWDNFVDILMEEIKWTSSLNTRSSRSRLTRRS